MPEADRLALEIVREIAKEKGIKVEVFDISSFKGKLKAKFASVKETPTIVVGNRKIEGIPDKEQILKLL
jgi:protein-disulfide isomerase